MSSAQDGGVDPHPPVDATRGDEAAAGRTSITAALTNPALTTRPLDVDGTTSVAIGCALWAIAGVVLSLFFRDELAADGRTWWLWTCLAGFGLGLLGWTYCRRRRDRLTTPR